MAFSMYPGFFPPNREHTLTEVIDPGVLSASYINEALTNVPSIYPLVFKVEESDLRCSNGARIVGITVTCSKMACRSYVKFMNEVIRVCQVAKIPL